MVPLQSPRVGVRPAVGESEGAGEDSEPTPWAELIRKAGSAEKRRKRDDVATEHGSDMLQPSSTPTQFFLTLS